MAQITTRKRGNTWEYSFEIASVDGKRKRKSKCGFRTKKDALEAGTQAKAEYDNTGVLTGNNSMSVADWLDFWYENSLAHGYKPTTKQSYQSIINIIKRSIGEYRVNALTPMSLTKMFNSLLNDGYADTTVRQVKRILSSALNYAYTMNVVKQNPCTNIRIKKNNSNSVQDTLIVTPELFEKILNLLENSWVTFYRIPFLIAWYTGMRGGEVMALTWNDVDFEKKLISVNKMQTVAFNKVHIKAPKTKSSIREIPVGDKLLNELREWQQTQIETSTQLGVKPPNEICTRNNLTSFSVKNLRDKSASIARELGMDFHFHCLRHTHATVLIKNGISIKEVQARLGHKYIQTTLDIYSHLQAYETTKSVDIFESLTNR